MVPFLLGLGSVVAVTIVVIGTVIITKWAVRTHQGHTAPTATTTAPSSGGVKWSQVIIWTLVGIPAAFVSFGCSGCIVRNWTIPHVFGTTQTAGVVAEEHGQLPEQELNLRGQWEPWSPGWTQTPGPSGYGMGFVLPPQTRHTACTFTDVRNEAYLVCGEDEPIPLSMEQLRQRAKSEADGEVWFQVFRIDPRDGVFSHRFWNNTDNISVLYVQSEAPSRVQVACSFPRCRHWIFYLDGQEDASFQTPEDWEYLWIVPLRSDEHLPSFGGTITTPEGISWPDLEGVLAQSQVEALRDGSVPDIAYRGLYWKLADGAASPLLQPITWHRSELSVGTEITLGINAVSHDAPEKPAGVLVGIKE